MEVREWMVALAVGIVPGIMGLAAAVFGTRAARKKDDATAASILTGSALQLMENMEAKINKLEKRIEDLEIDNQTWQREYRYLWDGNNENIKYIEHDLGKVAPFKPTIDKFRGTISYADKDWSVTGQTSQTNEESED